VISVGALSGRPGRATWVFADPAGPDSGTGTRQSEFEAEGFDLAGAVGNLAADGGGLPFVVVRAEILIPRARAGLQLVVDPQLGIAHRDLGTKRLDLR
jgi:hypothetical protein